MLGAESVLMVFNYFVANATNFTLTNETGVHNNSFYAYANISDGFFNRDFEETLPETVEDVIIIPDDDDSKKNVKNYVPSVSEVFVHVSKRDSGNKSADEAVEKAVNVSDFNKTQAQAHDELYEAREAAKARVQVKLNMKQALILNQAILVYGLTASKNPLCRNHSKEFQDGLRAFEPWAMKMFDSSSKLQSGILFGNLADLGSYKQCIDIYFKSQYGPITGKHCLLKIVPSDKVLRKILSYKNITNERFKHVKKSLNGAHISWAACVPQTCSSKDVLSHFNKSIMTIVEGLEVDITLSDIDCYSKIDDEKPMKKRDKIIMYALLGYFSVILICTFMDMWYRNKDVDRSRIIEIFSIYSNVAYLTKYQKEDAKLECLHGIRFISIIYVVFGHRYLMTLFFPSVNGLQILDWLVEYPSTLILGGTVSVDTFFLLSGSLVAYYFFEHMSKGGKFSYISFVLHRYLRLTPSYVVVVLFFSTFVEKMGSGPIWKRSYVSVQKPCQYFWWTSFLYIEPYVNPETICIIQTWYLSCDVQFYLLSPLIMYPLWKWKRFGVFNIFLCYIISLFPGFYMSWIRDLEIGMLMDAHLTLSEYFAHFYTMPYVRAPTYILGLGFGYILHRSKNAKIRMGRIALICGWMCSLTLMIGTLLGHNYFELESYEHNPLKESLFIATHRSLWTFGVIWVIWVCRSGYGGPVNALLSAEIFQILGRLVYSIFLIHMPLQFLILGAMWSPIHFSNFESVQKALGDFCLSMIFGFFLTILVEYPCSRISIHLFKVWCLPVKPAEEVKRNIE